MRFAACAFALLFALPGLARAECPFYLKDGDRVVFYGDSITDQRLYTTFAETYVVTRFPKANVKFVHSGWGGDRVTGGGGGPIDVRLDRDVIAYKPTVVTIMLGMNDGSYRRSATRSSTPTPTATGTSSRSSRPTCRASGSRSSSPRPTTTSPASRSSRAATTRS